MAQRKHKKFEDLDFLTILSQLKEIVYQTDTHGRWTYLNPAWERVTGHLIEESLGTRSMELVHPEDRRGNIQYFIDTIQNKAVGVREFRGIRADGNNLWIEFHSQALFNPAGKVVGTIGTILDITERKNSQMLLTEGQEQLLENKTFLESVLNHLPVALFCKDVSKNYAFTLWNSKSEELFGIKKEESLHKTDYDLFTQEAADTFRQKDVETMNQKEVVDIPEEPLDSPTYGRVYLHTLKVPIYDGQGNPRYLLGISEDITEKKKTEFKLIQASKMSTLGEMAAGVAHEINNPLTIIHAKASHLKMLVTQKSTPVEKIIEDLTKIEDTVMRIAKIVKGLKTFSRNGEKDPFSNADIDQILEDTFELCRERFTHHSIQLKVTSVPRLKLECRPVQISQVLINLLNNAFDAIHRKENPWIEVEIEPDGSNIKIRITDSGKGIPERVLSKLMVPFFTTKVVGQGTGLGLSISKGILEEHGGTIEYIPHNGHTSFTLIIPMKQS